MQAKNIIIILLVLALIGVVGYLVFNPSESTVVIEDTQSDTPIPVEPDGGIGDGAEPLDQILEAEERTETVIGTSAGGDTITAYHFGSGTNEVLVVGGTHGSYSQNTNALAQALIAHYRANEDEVPENVTLTIIPNLNPDGLKETGTAGRFNANDVDLNRNFDCEWSANAVWRSQSVSGGGAPFSEPEAQALRDYVVTNEPSAAIVYFSAEGKVYPSACAGAPSNASVTLAGTYAAAAGYPADAEFDAYAITGDMVNWMAKERIPAISVLLTDHENPETQKNLAALQAVLESIN